MSVWLLDRATLKIHYDEDNTPLEGFTQEYVKLFTLREYLLYIRADGQTEPTQRDLIGSSPNIFVACTDGQCIRLPEIKLTYNPPNSQKPGKDYKENPFGGVWEIAEYNYEYDIANKRWTTYTILRGQDTHWRRKKITDPVRTIYEEAP